jgi:hypothetical protein
VGYSQEEWTPLLIHEKGPVTGMPSPMIQKDQSKSKIIKQNSPRAVFSWRHSLFRASHGLMLVGGWGSINLYHSVWELPIMHVVWKIQPSHSCCVDSESMPLKMLFNLYFKIELWHLYKSLLPSAKGLSIYFYVE